MTSGMSEAKDLLTSEGTTTVTDFKDLKGSLRKSNTKNFPTPQPFVTKKYDVKYKWRNILVYSYVHIAFFYAVYLHIFKANWATVAFVWIYGILGGIGITAGSHRLYSHNSYKAKSPLRIILVILHCIANQNSMFKWARDHRCHHKFNETDADPINAKRGYLFSHIGWLLVNKHPDVLEKGKSVFMDDVKSCPYSAFQSRHFYLLGPLFCFVIPTLIPVYFFGETWETAWYAAGVLKFVLSSQFIWFLNSVGHHHGLRPYDRNQGGTDNKFLKYTTLGENWHNYHHTFPWDYASSEIGLSPSWFNITTSFIDMFSIIGWSYDRKRVPLEMVKDRALRTGDGSHSFNKEQVDLNHFWGWGDEDIKGDLQRYAQIVQ